LDNLDFEEAKYYLAFSIGIIYMKYIKRYSDIQILSIQNSKQIGDNFIDLALKNDRERERNFLKELGIVIEIMQQEKNAIISNDTFIKSMSIEGNGLKESFKEKDFKGNETPPFKKFISSVTTNDDYTNNKSNSDKNKEVIINKESPVTNASKIIKVLENSPKVVEKLNNDRTVEVKKDNYMGIVKKDDKDEIRFVNCPHCKVYVEKVDGCNFITCSSPYCKKNKYFCFICLAILMPSEKQTHFPNGIYSDFCINSNN